MYENNDLIIHLNKNEVQQVLAIWLDNDAEEALRFMQEKIVGRTLRRVCKQAPARKPGLCQVTKPNCACCRAGGLRKKESGHVLL